MAIYWQTVHDPDETAYLQVDWSDEMDAAGDTLTGTPTFTAIDAQVYGLTIANVSLSTDSKKVNLYVSNSDPATNRTDVLANSPYLYTHEVTTSGGQTLHRVVGIVVAERGSDLTVEDGGAYADSDSYAELEYADLYHLRMGNTDWTGTDAERSRALRRGTQYLDNRYIHVWKGCKATSGQSLMWPRDGMTDEDGNSIAADAIPQRLIDACCEAARIVPYTQKVSAPTEITSVAAGSVQVTFAGAKQERAVRDLVDELVAPFILTRRRLVRA